MNRIEEALQTSETKLLLGIAVYTGAPEFVEIAAYAGFHILWIEMEHAGTSFREAANLCRIGASVGMLTMIRIPDSTRATVLRAAECGPDIIDLPMANSPEVVEELVRNARYAPQGSRGMFGSSRAARYCAVNSMVEEQQRINEQLCLMAQIETSVAVDRAPELCSVSGLDAIFLGLGDLSGTLGVTGQINHPSVLQAADQAITVAKTNDKLVAVAGRPEDAGYWVKRGVDMLFCGSDTVCLRTAAQGVMRQVRESLDQST